MPSLPEPAYPDLESMLTRRFGREVANYFGGSPLNRLGFLRTDHVFLSNAFRHPSTSFLLCDNLQPMTNPEKKQLEFAKYSDVETIVGEDPYSESEEKVIAQYNSSRYVPQMIFLGIDEQSGSDDEAVFRYKDRHVGTPYFAVDITPRTSVKEECEALIRKMKDRGHTFASGRVMDLNASHAAIFAEARQLLDWNQRNPFCAQCGQPTLSTNAGFKRICPPHDLATLPTTAISTTPHQTINERSSCATRQGISNISFPRTDPTVIMAVVNHAGTHILLGRNKRYPPFWFSALAGFCEPAESIEEAVRRETYEEAGVKVARVVIHSTQPWPYPANLMIGAIAQSSPDGEVIDLGNDPELEDARWFPLDEVKEAMRVGTSGLDDAAGREYKEGNLRLPPPTAIANQLLKAVVEGYLTDSK